jgi:anti-anti-sigma factor
MLELRAQNLGEIVVLCLRGRIVIGDTDILRRVITELPGESVLVLDLRRVSEIDAHGLGVLLELREQLQSKGTELRLMNVTNLVGQVLEITKLDTVFQLTTEAETAARARPQRREPGELVLGPGDWGLPPTSEPQ